MATITLKNVSKRWKNFIAVNDFSLEIADREFLVLLGPSGCGKTTTMRMIAGLEEATSGEIWIGDRMVNGLAPRHRDIAMVFQGYGLYPNLSVYENIRYPLKARKVPKAEHHDKILYAAGMVELANLLHRRPHQLSGGQKQRVALARAIVREPNAFLMDEPLSNLDAKLRVSTRVHLKNLHRRLETTTIYVTHDQVEAMTLADRVVIMNGGLVQQIGTPVEIYDRPANAFVAGFIGLPAMNLVSGMIEDGTFRGPGLVLGGLPGGLNGPIILGFRAEDACLVAADGNLEGRLVNLDNMGDSTHLLLDLDGRAQVTIRGAKTVRHEPGAPIKVQLELDHCHFFSTNTGERVDL